MCVQHQEQCPYVRLGPRKAQVLAAYLESPSLIAASDRLGITPYGIKRHLAELKALARCEHVPELRSWWLQHRADWVLHMAQLAGLNLTMSEASLLPNPPSRIA